MPGGTDGNGRDELRGGSRSRVMLISMPFSSAHYPNLALGLLKPLALAAGAAACDVRYFSLDYLHAIGGERHDRLTDPAIYMAHAGEWVFAPLADPRVDPDDPSFLTDVLLRQHPDSYRPALLDALLAARIGAEDFITRCLEDVDWSRYAIVGFTTSFQQTMASLALARRIKARHPDVIFVLGGANCQEGMGLELLAQYPFLDAVCTGEGEHAFPELVRRHCLAAGGRSGAPPLLLDGIPGLAVRSRDGPRLPAPPAPRTLLEALPYPDFDDFFAQHGSNPTAAESYPPAVVFETARGCWWGAKHHCTFCGLNGTGMAYRSKSQDRAYEELAYLVRRHGCTDVANADNILDMEYFREFLPRLARSNQADGDGQDDLGGASGLMIYYEVKANLRADQIALLARAGVHKIQAGIEALDTKLLRLMRKGTTALQNVQLLKLAAEAGVYVEWLALCGFPGELPENYSSQAALIPLLRHLQPPAAFLRARADRFSPYHDAPDRYGVTLEPLPAYRHIYGCDADSQARLGYHFTMRSDALDGADAYLADSAREYGDWRAHQGASALWLEDRADNGAIVVVHDRRWGWPAADEVLDPPAAAVLRVAWQTVPWTRVLDELAPAMGGGAHAVATAADSLAARGWLIREGGQVLALPLRTSANQPGYRSAPSIAQIRETMRRGRQQRGTPSLDDVQCAPSRDLIPSAPSRDLIPSAPSRDDIPSAPSRDDIPSAPSRDTLTEAAA